MSIDLKFVELTTDVLEIFMKYNLARHYSQIGVIFWPKANTGQYIL